MTTSTMRTSPCQISSSEDYEEIESDKYSHHSLTELENMDQLKLPRIYYNKCTAAHKELETEILPLEIALCVYHYSRKIYKICDYNEDSFKSDIINLLGVQIELLSSLSSPTKELDLGLPGSLLVLEWYEIHHDYLNNADFTMPNIKLAVYVETKLVSVSGSAW